ncbi:MAG: hypothetical protein ACPIB5_07085, partial [Flavobacteriaceae bacterium]
MGVFLYQFVQFGNLINTGFTFDEPKIDHYGFPQKALVGIIISRKSKNAFRTNKCFWSRLSVGHVG